MPDGSGISLVVGVSVTTCQDMFAGVLLSREKMNLLNKLLYLLRIKNPVKLTQAEAITLYFLYSSVSKSPFLISSEQSVARVVMVFGDFPVGV